MSREHERSAPDPDAIVVECDFPESPAKVWKALTQPEWLAKWLLPEHELGRTHLQVLSAEPHRRLRLSWHVEEDDACGTQQQLDSIVTFELAETPRGGTHLRLVHGNFTVTSRETLMMLRQAA